MPLLNISDPEFTCDPEGPEGFRAGRYRLGPLVGAERTGTTLYLLPPGELLCPCHYEYGEEEWLLVLTGRPFLRTCGQPALLIQTATRSASGSRPATP
jgi:uncharacterized cupin superfamily protein